MSVVKTDYFSYAVAAVCHEEGDNHITDFIAFSRDKNPSIWSRNQMRNEFIHQGVDLSTVHNIEIEQCWGEDHY